MEIINPFSDCNSNYNSKEIDTCYGKLKINYNLIDNIDELKNNVKKSNSIESFLTSPYGKSDSCLYITAALPGEIENTSSEQRDHFLLSLYFNDINKKFSGVDNYNLDELKFDYFSLDDGKRKYLDDGRALLKGSSDLLLLPNTESILKNIGKLEINKIPYNIWLDYEPALAERINEAEKELIKAQKEQDKELPDLKENLYFN